MMFKTVLLLSFLLATAVRAKDEDTLPPTIPCTDCKKMSDQKQKCLEDCKVYPNPRCEKRCNRVNTKIKRCYKKCEDFKESGGDDKKEPEKCDGCKRANDECEKNTECDNGVCARASYTKDTKMVCCPGGKEYLDVSGIGYCGVQAAGQPCFTGSMCEHDKCTNDGTCSCNWNNQCPSSVCVSEQCKSGPQTSGQSCDDDSDCQNGACGKEKYEAYSPMICCPSGFRVFDPAGNKVCGRQGKDSKCWADVVCKPGMECIKNRCSYP